MALPRTRAAREHQAGPGAPPICEMFRVVARRCQRKALSWEIDNVIAKLATLEARRDGRAGNDLFPVTEGAMREKSIDSGLFKPVALPTAMSGALRVFRPKICPDCGGLKTFHRRRLPRDNRCLQWMTALQTLEGVMRKLVRGIRPGPAGTPGF